MRLNVKARPLVSIITPFLNAEKFLEECINSVLTQTYSNWELILIDDGSWDSSTNIAKRYAEMYPDKIFYREHEGHENRGASASRNMGIQISKGEYIAFLDSDDIYLPNKLQDQVVLLNACPDAGMLYAATEYWYSWTGLSEDVQKDRVWNNFGVPINTLMQPPQLLTIFLRDGGTVPCMGSVLARRRAINAVGGWENSFKYIYTDQVFHAKMCLNWPVYIANGCWDKYRQHPDSACHIVERANKTHEARHHFLMWLEKYLIEQGANKNRDLWEAFKQSTRPFKQTYFNKLATLKASILNKIKNKLS